MDTILHDRFIHLLILYLMHLPEIVLDEEGQRAAIENSKAASLFDDEENRILLNGERIPLREAAQSALDGIEQFARTFAPDFLPAVAYQKEKFHGKRYAELVRDRFTDYISDGLRLAERLRGSSCACYSGSALSKIS